MGNEAVTKTSIFKRALGLLDTKASHEAGFDAVGKSIAKRTKNIDDVNAAYASYIGSKSKEASEEALNFMKKNGLKIKDGENVQDAIDSFQANLKDKIPNKKAFEADRGKFLDENMGYLPSYAGGAIKDYFTNGTAKQLGARYGVAGGIYAAGTVGGRYANGGTMTRDRNGNSDIAGIPFL